MIGQTSQKQQQIEATAQALFFAHGIRRVTVEEICSRAGVSKSTFYTYFSNKTDLVVQLRDRLVTEGLEQFDRIEASDRPFPVKIEEMTRWRVEFFSQMSGEFIEQVFDLPALKDEFRNRFRRNLVTAQQRGELRPEISLELVWQVTEKLNELVADGTWKEVASDYGEYQAQLRRLIFFGLLSIGDREGA